MADHMNFIASKFDYIERNAVHPSNSKIFLEAANTDEKPYEGPV